MKKIFVLLLLISLSVCAEIPSQGLAIYKQTSNNHMNLPESQAAMKAFIPKFSYNLIDVLFKNNLLNPKIVPFTEGKNSSLSQPIFLNKSTKIIDTQDNTLKQFGKLVGINYLVDIKEINSVKFSDEVEIINDYECNKAIVDDTVIWYKKSSTAIVPDEKYLYIPGLVVKIEGKSFSYELLELKQQNVDDLIFNIPKDHKNISFQQFQDLKEEALEEMMQSMGGGAKMIKVGD